MNRSELCSISFRLKTQLDDHIGFDGDETGSRLTLKVTSLAEYKSCLILLRLSSSRYNAETLMMV